MSYTIAIRSRVPLCRPKAMAAATGSSRMRTILYRGGWPGQVVAWTQRARRQGEKRKLTESRPPLPRAPWLRAARQ